MKGQAMQEWVQEIGQAMRDKVEGLFGEPEKDYTGIRVHVSARMGLTRATEFREKLDSLIFEYFDRPGRELLARQNLHSKPEEGLEYTIFAVLTPTKSESARSSP